MSDYIVYDAGALIAAEKNNRLFLAAHETRLRAGIIPLLPAPVLSQVWAPGGRYYTLHRVISGCRVMSYTAEHAHGVALLCRASRHPDVVDGFVALIAINYAHAPIVTSDVDDITKLLAAASSPTRVPVYQP